MNEKQTQTETTEQQQPIRPTKKQRELLTFIEQFITEHGYSPSYREIMSGLNYTSVATVALHVKSLIKRGHLRKRDYSARSLEVVRSSGEPKKLANNQVAPGEERWLIEKIEHVFTQAESLGAPDEATLSDLSALLQALRALGLSEAAQSFSTRFSTLRQTAQA